MPDIPVPGAASPVRTPRESVRRGPLDGAAPIPGPVSVTLAGPIARIALRGGSTVADAASAALGMALPREACRAVRSGDRAALWLGPDEWLLMAPPEDGAADALAAALRDLPCSLVDIGHRQLGLVLDGPRAAELLNAACPLDLAEQAFPPSACTRTVLGKAEIVLWRTGPSTFHLDVWRSFAAYVHALLAESAQMLPRLAARS